MSPSALSSLRACSPAARIEVSCGRLVPFADRRSSTVKGEVARAVLYVLTLGGDPITRQSLEGAEADRAIERAAAWWREHRAAGRVVAACKLMPPHSATTVRFGSAGCLVVDGTFNPEADAIGGFGVIDVTDLDEALAVARTWPLDGYIEIRPLMSSTGRVYGYRANPRTPEEDG